jgi:ribosomal protein L40E
VVAAEPVVAVEPEPEPEPEPVVAAEPEPEPEPVAAEPTRVDVVEQPTWQIVAPEEPPTVEPPVATPPVAPTPVAPTPVVPPPAAAPDPVQPAATAEPQWPTQPQWPQAQQSTNGLPYFGRPAIPTGGLESLRAESAREVTTAPAETARAGVQPCVSCGLSLSATARFCRRCGTRQG